MLQVLNQRPGLLAAPQLCHALSSCLALSCPSGPSNRRTRMEPSAGLDSFILREASAPLLNNPMSVWSVWGGGWTNDFIVAPVIKLCKKTSCALLRPLLSTPEVTPPGYYTSNGTTQPCPDGSFRADWKPAAEASSCTLCGVGVLADKTDRVTKYNLVSGVPQEIPVTTSSDDCCECILGWTWAQCAGLSHRLAGRTSPLSSVEG